MPRPLRIALLVAVPVAAFAGGLALGYSAGQLVPSPVAVFGQLAEHVVLVERVRAGEIETFERMALPTIALSALALHHGGYFSPDAEPRVVAIARRGLDLLRDSEDARVGRELRTQAIDVLAGFLASVPEPAARAGAAATPRHPAPAPEPNRPGPTAPGSEPGVD